ncbi:MAG: alpha/beta fold hydrolase [Rhizomicrobium sp.]
MSTSVDIMPGAEPLSVRGDRRGALVIHGFTGCPQSMRPLAESFVAAGFSVEMPRLPGHGTTPEDMANFGWGDWTAAVDAVYRDLSARTDKVVVAGLSMGGALTLWLAERHREIAGIIAINAVVESDDFAPLAEAATAMQASGQRFVPGVAGDIADPLSKELGYDRFPASAVGPLVEGVAGVKQALAGIKCPALILHSLNDHVVPPGSAKLLRERLGGAVEYVPLERSFHVATIDYDRAEINRRSVEFGQRVTT